MGDSCPALPKGTGTVQLGTAEVPTLRAQDTWPDAVGEWISTGNPRVQSGKREGVQTIRRKNHEHRVGLDGPASIIAPVMPQFPGHWSKRDLRLPILEKLPVAEEGCVRNARNRENVDIGPERHTGMKSGWLHLSRRTLFAYGLRLTEPQ